MQVYSVIRTTERGSQSSYSPGHCWMSAYDDVETAQERADLYNLRAVHGIGVRYWVIEHEETANPIAAIKET